MHAGTGRCDSSVTDKKYMSLHVAHGIHQNRQILLASFHVLHMVLVNQPARRWRTTRFSFRLQDIYICTADQSLWEAINKLA